MWYPIRISCGSTKHQMFLQCQYRKHNSLQNSRGTNLLVLQEKVLRSTVSMNDNDKLLFEAETVLEIVELKERVAVVEQEIDKISASLKEQRHEPWIVLKPALYLLNSMIIEKHVIYSRLDTLKNM